MHMGSFVQIGWIPKVIQSYLFTGTMVAYLIAVGVLLKYLIVLLMG